MIKMAVELTLGKLEKEILYIDRELDLFRIV